MSSEISIGEVFAGRYRIEALLGRGGMGAVYRAQDEAVGDVVALKTLTVAGGRAGEAVERFRREVRLARRITHPNVARIHDLGEHEGTHFLTMEYVRGRDLSQLVAEEGPLSPQRTAELLAPVADALAAIHGAGIVHRDLKPANVLVEDGGRVVLADFGIARASVDRAAALKTAGPIGTPLYMAPEQISGAPVGPRTDLYALGLLLYELATGEVPFEEKTPLATALARLTRPPPDPRERAEVSDDLADLVLGCLAREPVDRPSSAQEVAGLLRRLATGVGRAPELAATTPACPLTPPDASTISPGDRALAILPFRHRGSAEHDYLADALTDELIDLLSTTRGLRVLASGATAGYADDRDPRKVGRELGVEAIVDGTIQTVGSKVRVAARLCDAHTGTVLWSEKLEGSLEDVFELQDRMGRRIAESLRVGLGTTTARGDLPAEAVEAYLRARKKMRGPNMMLATEEGPIMLLERSIELAPGFGPALAAHAMATTRAWFIPGARERDWEAVARESVERALREAGRLAETHLAAAILAVQDSRYTEAARELELALSIAPTYADAHDYMGRLQCEAGMEKEGLRRLHLAMDLDPTLSLAWLDIARVRWLTGDREGAHEAQARLGDATGLDHPATIGNWMRFACWEGDEAALREAQVVARRGSLPAHAMLAIYGSIVLGDITPEAAETALERVESAIDNKRFRAIAQQLGAEAMAKVGRPEQAMCFLRDVSEEVLIDVLWLDRCPALESARALPAFAEVRGTVALRAGQIWRG